MSDAAESWVRLILFIVGGAGAVLGGLLLILAKSPLRGALYLIGSLCGVALLYLLLEAPFVAAMQILVYAGAILVLFVFVIMLLNLGPDDSGRPAYVSWAKVLGAAAIVFLCVKTGLAVVNLFGAPAVNDSFTGSVKQIGTLLLTDYLFAFEAISAVLLVAIVGAVVLGLRRLT